MARFTVRAGEARTSLRLIAELAGQARTLSATAAPVPHGGGAGLGITEGWRGSTVHRVEVTPAGILTRCKIVDPSFLNWPALSVALADTIVPDFPLANKSFNLSYAGNDLLAGRPAGLSVAARASRRTVTGQEPRSRPPAAGAGHRRFHGRTRPGMSPVSAGRRAGRRGARPARTAPR
jgi:hypothetical protein